MQATNGLRFQVFASNNITLNANTMTTEEQKQDHGNGFDRGHILYLDYHYSVKCIHCGEKLMDPDKKKNQQHLKGVCPHCHKDSKDFKPPSKPKQKKLSKKEKRRIQQEKDAIARSKY